MYVSVIHFPFQLATDVNPSDKYKDVIATDSTQPPAVSGMGYKGLSYSTITVKILLENQHVNCAKASNFDHLGSQNL